MNDDHAPTAEQVSAYCEAQGWDRADDHWFDKAFEHLCDHPEEASS